MLDMLSLHEHFHASLDSRFSFDAQTDSSYHSTVPMLVWQRLTHTHMASVCRVFSSESLFRPQNMPLQRSRNIPVVLDAGGKCNNSVYACRESIQH